MFSVTNGLEGSSQYLQLDQRKKEVDVMALQKRGEIWERSNYSYDD